MAQATTSTFQPALCPQRETLPCPDLFYPLSAGTDTFQYEALHCNSVEKETTTKEGKQDLQEKAKMRAPLKLMSNLPKVR